MNVQGWLLLASFGVGALGLAYYAGVLLLRAVRSPFQEPAQDERQTGAGNHIAGGQATDDHERSRL